VAGGERRRRRKTRKMRKRWQRRRMVSVLRLPRRESRSLSRTGAMGGSGYRR
jgi:hypothetical protein